jgi:ATP-dependent DNA ligase
MVVVEVRYRMLTKGGKLRHPIFYRLRDEIAPPEIDFPAVLPP